MNVLKFKSFDESEEQLSQNTEMSKHTWVMPQDSGTNLQQYLKKVLNRFVKVDLLIGNDTLISKEGILNEVGTDYIVLEMLQSNDLLVCDIYSIKFVQII